MTMIGIIVILSITTVFHQGPILNTKMTLHVGVEIRDESKVKYQSSRVFENRKPEETIITRGIERIAAGANKEIETKEKEVDVGGEQAQQQQQQQQEQPTTTATQSLTTEDIAVDLEQQQQQEKEHQLTAADEIVKTKIQQEESPDSKIPTNSREIVVTTQEEEEEPLTITSTPNATTAKTITVPTTPIALWKSKDPALQKFHNFDKTRPVMVVGFPKSGTTSVYEMFKCSNVPDVSHYCCCGSTVDHPPCGKGKGLFAYCIMKNLQKNQTKNVLENCGTYNIYAQLDGEMALPPHKQSIFLPQHHHLEELHRVSPNSVWILNVRPADQWAKSVLNWFVLSKRFLRRFNIVFERTTYTDRLIRIYNNHTRVVREFVEKHPTHTLVEFDITNPEDARQKMVEAFGLDPDCWGQANKNSRKNTTITIEPQ